MSRLAEWGNAEELRTRRTRRSTYTRRLETALSANEEYQRRM